MPTRLGVVLKINSSIEGISRDRIHLYPFPHIVIDNFFSESDWDDIKGELVRLETAIPDNKFESEFGVKNEWKNFDLNFCHTFIKSSTEFFYFKRILGTQSIN